MRANSIAWKSVTKASAGDVSSDTLTTFTKAMIVGLGDQLSRNYHPSTPYDFFIFSVSPSVISSALVHRKQLSSSFIWGLLGERGEDHFIRPRPKLN
ncbi:hypothetical protein CEXT_195511 [Caerostris extrusa]|uniref:Uncharacterized protein n=1 Tax=Caerostris extrusa TaxID=172846 RepID=A0AAV4U3H6_CAEEX|nr:hypothetical protein CEXT_195511 [Caerostris extrusa]